MPSPLRRDDDVTVQRPREPPPSCILLLLQRHREGAAFTVVGRQRHALWVGPLRLSRGRPTGSRDGRAQRWRIQPVSVPNSSQKSRCAAAQFSQVTGSC